VERQCDELEDMSPVNGQLAVKLALVNTQDRTAGVNLECIRFCKL